VNFGEADFAGRKAPAPYSRRVFLARTHNFEQSKLTHPLDWHKGAVVLFCTALLQIERRADGSQLLAREATAHGDGSSLPGAIQITKENSGCSLMSAWHFSCAPRCMADAQLDDHLEHSLLIEQTAELLGVSRRTVYYRIREGRLRTIHTRCHSQRVLVSSIFELLRQMRDSEAGKRALGQHAVEAVDQIGT
jgi:excisionase family DNA binding protein